MQRIAARKNRNQERIFCAALPLSARQTSLTTALVSCTSTFEKTFFPLSTESLA